jgi:hypothetical protein
VPRESSALGGPIVLAAFADPTWEVFALSLRNARVPLWTYDSPFRHADDAWTSRRSVWMEAHHLSIRFV